MGNCFLVVNPDKREYLDPSCFGDNDKTGGYMQGYHAIAVAMLACPSPGLSIGPLDGFWNGDRIVTATESASPNQHGLKTVTDDFPNRNLYKMSCDEFENLSYKALAMICERSKNIAADLAKRAKSEFDNSNGRSTFLLSHLGNCFFGADGSCLDEALSEFFDEDWKDIYERTRQFQR